jgi:hypothetical protein
LITL